jgi:hypothetical protein
VGTVRNALHAFGRAGLACLKENLGRSNGSRSRPSFRASRPPPDGQSLQKGKTYRSVVKTGFDARVEDKARGVKQVVTMAYAAEFVMDRIIEQNDGQTVVGRRHYDTARNVKLLCDVEDVSIDLGTPGVVLLGALEYLRPGTTAVVAIIQPIAEAILATGQRQAVRGEAARAVAHVDSLACKTVRITYTDAESVEPVGCAPD